MNSFSARGREGYLTNWEPKASFRFPVPQNGLEIQTHLEVPPDRIWTPLPEFVEDSYGSPKWCALPELNSLVRLCQIPTPRAWHTPHLRRGSRWRGHIGEASHRLSIADTARSNCRIVSQVCRVTSAVLRLSR